MDNATLEAQAVELRTQFLKTGYVSIPGFLDTDELNVVTENVGRLITEVVPTMPREEVFYEDIGDPATLKQIQRIYRIDPFFESLMLGGKVERLAEVLLGEDVVPQNLQYFNKPPGVGRETPPHQDGYFQMLTPSQAVTMWLALEDVSEEQGCVRYVKGSHRFGLRRHARSEVLGFSQYILDYPQPNDLENEVALPCKAGQMLVHHALTVHRADGNRTADRTRQALGFTFYGVSAAEDTKAREAYARALQADLVEQGKI